VTTLVRSKRPAHCPGEVAIGSARATLAFVCRSIPLFPPLVRGDERGVPVRNFGICSKLSLRDVVTQLRHPRGTRFNAWTAPVYWVGSVGMSLRRIAGRCRDHTASCLTECAQGPGTCFGNRLPCWISGCWWPAHRRNRRLTREKRIDRRDQSPDC